MVTGSNLEKVLQIYMLKEFIFRNCNRVHTAKAMGMSLHALRSHLQKIGINEGETQGMKGVANADEQRLAAVCHMARLEEEINA